MACLPLLSAMLPAKQTLLKERCSKEGFGILCSQYFSGEACIKLVRKCQQERVPRRSTLLPCPNSHRPKKERTPRQTEPEMVHSRVGAPIRGAFRNSGCLGLYFSATASEFTKQPRFCQNFRSPEVIEVLHVREPACKSAILVFVCLGRRHVNLRRSCVPVQMLARMLPCFS